MSLRWVAAPSAIGNMAVASLAALTGQWLWFGTAAVGAAVSIYGWWLAGRDR